MRFPWRFTVGDRQSVAMPTMSKAVAGVRTRRRINRDFIRSDVMVDKRGRGGGRGVAAVMPSSGARRGLTVGVTLLWGGTSTTGVATALNGVRRSKLVACVGASAGAIGTAGRV